MIRYTKRWRERWWKPPRSTNLAEILPWEQRQTPSSLHQLELERSTGTSARPQVLWTTQSGDRAEYRQRPSSLNPKCSGGRGMRLKLKFSEPKQIVGEERGWSPSSLNRKWSAPADSAGFHAILNGRIGPWHIYSHLSSLILSERERMEILSLKIEHP